MDRLSKISDLIDSIPEISRQDDEDLLKEKIKELSRNHIVLKSHLTPIQKATTEPAMVHKIEEMNKKTYDILNPIYDELLRGALEHCEEWYKRVRMAMGEEEPEIFDYQSDELRFFFRSIIRKEFAENIYTLAMSRGSGKTYMLSVGVAFLAIYWKEYIFHAVSTDYTILFTAPYDKQLDSFRRYFTEILSVCKNIGIIATTEGDDSETGVYEFKNNKGEYGLRNQNGGSNHCNIINRLSAESLEGVHCDLGILDEAKMISKNIFLTSLLPTVGGRNGILLAMSSASSTHCYFQTLVEQNVDFDRTLLEQGGRDYIYMKGQFNERGFECMGETLFIKNFRSMIVENYQYTQTIQRFLNTIGCNISEMDSIQDPSWLSQYENIFSSDKKSSFFDIGDMRQLDCVKDVDPNFYIGNSNWVIVAGWDVAVDNDQSILTIKAIENKVGTNRKSVLLSTDCLNPNRNPVSEATHKQADSILRLCIYNKVASLVIDTTGIGKGLDVMIKESLREIRKSNPSIVLQENNIFGVNINVSTRNEFMENYYKRLTNGLEIVPLIPKEVEDESDGRRQYSLAMDAYDSKSMMIKFIHEHVKFQRVRTHNEKTGIEMTKYIQSNENYLHDDFVLSSSLCSYNILKNPALLNMHGMNKNSQQKNFFKVQKGRRFR